MCVGVFACVAVLVCVYVVVFVLVCVLLCVAVCVACGVCGVCSPDLRGGENPTRVWWRGLGCANPNPKLVSSLGGVTTSPNQNPLLEIGVGGSTANGTVQHCNWCLVDIGLRINPPHTSVETPSVLTAQ